MLISATKLGLKSDKNVYELSRELQKLEVRAKDVMEEEELFLKAVENHTNRFKDIKEFVEARRNDFEALTKLQLEAYEALNETLKAQSRVEQEKSYILESYDALVMSVGQELANYDRHQKLS